MNELKKRFQKLVPEHFGGMQHDLMASCELVAEKFSLDFTNWLMDSCELSHDNSSWSFNSEDYTNEKLLEIYKKEIEK